jgi:hypothetical protein
MQKIHIPKMKRSYSQTGNSIQKTIYNKQTLSKQIIAVLRFEMKKSMIKDIGSNEEIILIIFYSLPLAHIF